MCKIIKSIERMKWTIFFFFICGALADEALQDFANGNRKFTASLYKEIIKNVRGNFVASPLSAEAVLALTYEGAKGDTATELIKGLSLPTSIESTQAAFKSLLPNLKTSEGDLKLVSANKIYVSKDLKFEDRFRSVATSIYKSDVGNVDFGKNVEAAATINNWVEENTNNKIKNLIKSTDITENTRMILVNALYFNGRWLSPFETFTTEKKYFYKTKDDSAEVDTMQQVDTFSYYENPSVNAKFLELPYRGANISMVIVLPNQLEGLTNLQQNIQELVAPQPVTKERVKVELPKFIIETETDFIPILKTLGIRKLFTEDADLSGISSTDRALYVSNILQKAFINVTETGTEAAAATYIGVALLSAPIALKPTVIFRADHPFIFYIRDNNSGVILFFGRYTGK